MTMVTIQMVDLAASRYHAEGYDFTTYTAHKIAHDLVEHDAAFKGADYTTLVSLINHWHRGYRG